MIKQIITINDDGKVDARELHMFLEVSTKFSDWIRRKIEQYDFVENKDFWTQLNFAQRADGTVMPNQKLDYLLTITMAKELCMLENNDKGKQARLYFIKCEEERKVISKLEIMRENIDRLIAAEKTMRKHDAQLEEQSKKIDSILYRLSNLDGIDIDGTPRQILNSMVRYYAFNKPTSFSNAWLEFYSAFNIAYHTNIKRRYKGYISANNLTQKDFSMMDFLEEIGLVEDGIRVADKLIQKI